MMSGAGAVAGVGLDKALVMGVHVGSDIDMVSGSIEHASSP